MVITMASYALQTPPRVAHAKPPGPTAIYLDNLVILEGLLTPRGAFVHDQRQEIGCEVGQPVGVSVWRWASINRSYGGTTVRESFKVILPIIMVSLHVFPTGEHQL